MKRRLRISTTKPKELGALIRSLRKDLGLSLREVAEKTGMGTAHVSRIELGQSVPTVSTLNRLASVLKVKWVLVAKERK